MTRTALYRHFDADGGVLYVGISTRPWVRQAAHARQSEWFGAVSSVSLEWFACQEDACAAEASAIRIHRPKHNKTHLPLGAAPLRRGRFQVSASGWAELAARGLTMREAADLAGSTYEAARKAASAHSIRFARQPRGAAPPTEAAQ